MAKDEINMTKLELRFLSVFLNSLNKKFYATEIAEILSVSYGSVIPLLMRFEKMRWLEIEWENIDPRVEGRPKRKYFGLSEVGITKAKQLVRDEIAFLNGKKVAMIQ